MKLHGNTVLITGGSGGIGFALAERFLAAGNEVIICGRNQDKLNEAKGKHAEFHTYQCDIENEEERVALFEQVVKEFPKLNVLINNAGVQYQQDLKKEHWKTSHKMIATNLEGVIHFCSLFIPKLMEQEDAYIINVSSGQGFVPSPALAAYSATKSALHSYTFSLRKTLADTSIDVVEIIPPPVDTDLGGKGMHTYGISITEFANGIWEGLNEGWDEVGYGRTANIAVHKPEQAWFREMRL